MLEQKENRTVYIYGLYSDVDKDNIRYIGKTVIDIDKRLKQHINESKRICKTHKHKWIRSVNKVNIRLLETCCEDTWIDKEKLWISRYDNLTNHTTGGEGMCGYTKYDITYTEAKSIIDDLNIRSKSQFYNYFKSNKINNFPNNPREYFIRRNCWISWGDFFGTNYIQDNIKASNYLNYSEAKEYIKTISYIKNSISYEFFIKNEKITNLPLKPDRYYSNKNRGWINWKDYLNH